MSLGVLMLRLVIPMLCLALSACGWFSEEESEPEPEGPRLVGRVASVHGEDGFVLVQGFDDLKLGEGLILTTRGEEDRAASLVVTGERAGRYAAADVKGGTVEVGDAVFARPAPDEDVVEAPVDEKVSPSNP